MSMNLPCTQFHKTALKTFLAYSYLVTSNQHIVNKISRMVNRKRIRWTQLSRRLLKQFPFIMKLHLCEIRYIFPSYTVDRRLFLPAKFELGINVNSNKQQSHSAVYIYLG